MMKGSKVVQQWLCLLPMWRSLRYLECCRGRESGLSNRTSQSYWSWLWQLRSTCYGFVGILYSTRLILPYNSHLKGRQTVENHTSTHSYQRIHTYIVHNDLIKFPPQSTFQPLLFSQNQVCQNCENLHPLKISCYTVIIWFMSENMQWKMLWMSCLETLPWYNRPVMNGKEGEFPIF